MKSKNIYKILFIGSLCFSLYSCSLVTEPLSSLSELTVGNNNSSDSIKYKYSTKAEIYTQYRNLYQLLKDRQEHWYLDMLLVGETHSDNAYAGTTGSEVIPMENNSVDAANSCLARDWDRYLADVAQANAVICNIDSVPDQTLTAQERKQWKAEAMIFRAMIWFDMVRLWGNIPIVTKEGVDITAENIEQVYPLYYPKQTDPKAAYTQIASDLIAAIPDAPAKNAADKTILSKSVARALLAKVYAEKTIRDYSKVVQYCNEVIADGFSLVSNYADLFSLNSAGTDAKLRSSSESILEVNYFTGGGNWVTWMFGRDLLDYNYYFTWAKWITPSRDLIADFKSENDNVRLNQTIVYYVSTWSNYYPAANYPFMYKCRSNVSSLIKFRYADILLLKAEALAGEGGATNLADAATIVNTVRSRVGLANLPSTASTTSESMLTAVLHERRLELAFEGQRWFDLVRTGKLADVMNTLNKRDSGRLPQRRAFTETSELLPVPQAALDINTNLVQNPGY